MSLPTKLLFSPSEILSSCPAPSDSNSNTIHQTRSALTGSVLVILHRNGEFTSCVEKFQKFQRKGFQRCRIGNHDTSGGRSGEQIRVNICWFPVESIESERVDRFAHDCTEALTYDRSGEFQKRTRYDLSCQRGELVQDQTEKRRHDCGLSRTHEHLVTSRLL